MKKILAQKFFAEADISNIVTLYTVPVHRHTLIHSIYINFNNQETQQRYSKIFNLRVVPVGGPADWTTLATPELREIAKYQYMVLSDPKKEEDLFPLVYTEITMGAGDFITMQAMMSGVSITIFGEELQYDYDDIVARLDTMNTRLNSINNNLSGINSSVAVLADCLCPPPKEGG